MTNVMRAEPLEAINERAKTFVSKCAEAGRKSVDVYVRFPNLGFIFCLTVAH